MIHSFEILILLSPCVFSWPGPRNLGISGGAETTGPSYQAFLDIVKNDSPCWDPDTIFSCTGTTCSGAIISETAVIVPAYCADNAKDMFYGVSVIGGAHNVRDHNSNWQSSFGSGIYINPDYNSSSATNDIAVVTANTRFKFNNYVRKIDIADEEIENLEGKTATLIGWGETYEGEFYLVPEQELNITIISNEECAKYYDDIDDTLLCTSGEGGVGACSGDDGSPLAVDGVLVGLVKRIPSKCGAEEPTVYTRISKYSKWIKNVAGL